jgi:WD40 repeat protein
MRTRLIGVVCVGLLVISAAAQGVRTPKTDPYGDPLPPGCVARMGTVRLRHHTIIMSLALSPDGKTAASAGGFDYNPNECIRLWDVASGKELRQLVGDERHPSYVVFSPDGSVLASMADGPDKDITIRIWKVDTGKLLHTLQPNANLGRDKRLARHIAFSPDSKTLACWGNDPHVRLWDLGTGKQLSSWPVPASGCLFYSPDGQLLVTSKERTLSFWNPSNGKLARSIEFSTESAVTPRFLARGGTQIVCTGSKPVREVTCFDCKTGTTVRKIPGSALGWSGNGRFIAIRDKADICVWDLTEGKEVRRFSAQGRFVNHSLVNDYTGGMTNDGTTLVSADWNTIRVFDIRNGKEVNGDSGHWTDVVFVGFSADDSRVVSAGDKSVRIWDITGSKELARLTGHTSFITNAALTKDGKTLATGSWDGSARLWDLSMPVEKAKLNVGPGKLLVAFSPTENRLATKDSFTSKKECIQIWDLKTGLALRRFGSGSGGEGLAFLPDGSLVDLTINITVFDPESGRQLRYFDKMPYHNLPTTSLAMSSDSRMAALGYRDTSALKYITQDVSVWEMASATMIAHMKGHKAAVASLAFSPDMKLLATGSWDGTIRIWDWISRRELACFSGHRGGVLSVAFSHNGRLLATGGSDSSIMVWDVSSLAPRQLPAPLPADKLVGPWDQMLDRDAANAYVALAQFVGSRTSAASFLKRHLLDKKTREERVTVLLAALDDPVFKTRQTANRELEGMFPDIEPILRKALKGTVSAELRGRVDALLAKPPLTHGEVSGYRLRQLRAVQVLEYLQDEEPLRLLQELTKVESDDFLAREAIRALERLRTRTKKAP